MRPSPGGSTPRPFGVRTTALLLAIVAVADVATVVVRHRRATPPRPVSALERVLPELQSFVERERGLRFRHPVEVELKTEAEFNAAIDKLRVEARRSGPSPDVLVGLLRALGLVEGRFDQSILERDIDERILGYYDTDRGRLLVRGDEPTPAIRRVLVHELTHALDDQHFRLDRREIDRRDDEAPIAFASLVEGDAVRVESRYVESLSPEDKLQAEVDVAPVTRPPGDIPRIFEILLTFPYVSGRSFVEALLAAGGTAAVDAAFAKPPTTTEAILHPDRYLADDGPEPVRNPPADDEVVDRGVLGELLLRLVLQSTLDRETAARAAEGWRGDRYTAWSDAGRVCIRDRMLMDSAADRAEMAAGLQRWAQSHPGTDLDDPGTGPITVTRCG